MCVYNLSNKSVIKCGFGPFGCWVKEALYDGSNVLDVFHAKSLAQENMASSVVSFYGFNNPISVSISINDVEASDEYFVQYFLSMDQVEELQDLGVHPELLSNPVYGKSGGSPV